MKIESIVVGPLQSNCYIVYDEKGGEAIVIDPGDEAGKIIGLIEQRELKVKYIVCTHGHFDHVGAVSALKKKTGAPVVLNREDLEIWSLAGEQAAFWGYEIDQPAAPDMFVIEGDELSAGDFSLRVLHTPGHSQGGICLHGEGILFTGDTVFAGSVGRTDFPGGSLAELRQSFREIISFPPETKILPGHGPSSTVGEEKETNFFVSELL
jgi:glyoxylase-like metal-dependent hydrolase (beta-lactamase superfamily II)